MRLVMLLILAMGVLGACSNKDTEAIALGFRSCASAQPTLTGKWILTEFRYYGGCCPVIADSTWKKADTTPELRSVIEFTDQGKLIVYNAPKAAQSNVNGAFASADLSRPLETKFTANATDIALNEQILGGGPWYKIVKLKKLTTNTLTIAILVGKEGEMNDRTYLRLCE